MTFKQRISAHAYYTNFNIYYVPTYTVHVGRCQSRAGSYNKEAVFLLFYLFTHKVILMLYLEF